MALAVLTLAEYVLLALAVPALVVTAVAAVIHYLAGIADAVYLRVRQRNGRIADDRVTVVGIRITRTPRWAIAAANETMSSTAPPPITTTND